MTDHIKEIGDKAHGFISEILHWHDADDRYADKLAHIQHYIRLLEARAVGLGSQAPPAEAAPAEESEAGAEPPAAPSVTAVAPEEKFFEGLTALNPTPLPVAETELLHALDEQARPKPEPDDPGLTAPDPVPSTSKPSVVKRKGKQT